MIVSRTPLRISIGGGGSDLPSFYERHGGFFISAAITKYVYIGISKSFTGQYFVRYTSQERVGTIDEIRHPIMREALRLQNVGPVEVVSLADVPAGTGLGSSGSFTVGLLRALYAYRRESVSNLVLAEEACYIEMDLLNEPVGKQDPYIASVGGFTCFRIDEQGRVTASPLPIPAAAIHDLEDHLLLFFTGYSREASHILEELQSRSLSSDQIVLANMRSVVEIAHQIKDELSLGNTRGFGDLMHDHWLAKRTMSARTSNGQIDRWYEVGRANGARGGKLVGAGGGGFLMFYADEPDRLREVMQREGLDELRFSFDFDGTTIALRD